ncbi:putative MFS family arabinose efflux permease [Rhodococcus sp. AG1013]|uniref:MFS transporter n=1 Tax=Rhodococcus sp. AG1013 TaxID=2183996 RepID=UPI000E0AF3F2|nr:MFS transporter [Rhodococcus sp. AG1013]RDI18030.1 putative MFS family arabinose efflux permease [Rhodococcus sp. AG1013]
MEQRQETGGPDGRQRVSRTAAERPENSSVLLVPSLVFIALVVAAVGSLGAPLITSVATTLHVSLASAQWTLTITLLTGAIATPVLGRLGAGPHRRGTILVTLGVVVAGSVLTALPLPFAWLLVGRAAQGVGLGLTALMMGVARDHLPEDRAVSTIALVSVASTIGIGVGYPLAGLLTELGGLRAAYGLGVVVTAVALVAALRSMPVPPEGRSARVDVPGALLLAAGLLLVLLLASETSLWNRHLGLAVALAVVAVLLLGVWTAYERHAKAPLVDVRLIRHPAVAGANAAMFVGGIGMYLLVTLITRYAQTPHGAGYGFGLSTFVAGLVLVPFSLMGFVSGKLTPRLRDRIGGPALLAATAIVVLGAFALFAVARSNLTAVLVSMAILGFGVGSFSAAMPAVILAVTPKSETSSAMSFNQVVRSVGFSIGSAVGGLMLAAGTPAGELFPTDDAYTSAACIGMAAMAVTAITCITLARRPGPRNDTGTTPGARRPEDHAGSGHR